MRKIFLIFLFISPALSSGAQKTIPDIDALMFKADSLFTKESYDSALLHFEKALELLKERDLLSDFRTPILYNFIGKVQVEKGNLSAAHDNYILGLKYARERKNLFEKAQILSGLMQVQDLVRKNSYPFEYPQVRETELVKVYFPVLSFEERPDSLDVIIGGGKFDGIGDSARTVDLFTHISPKDTIHHKELDFYGTARVVQVDNNTMLVRVKKHEIIPLLKGDFVLVKTSVPLAWRKLSLRYFLVTDIFLKGNYRESLYNYRYFYYFADSLLEKDVFDLMRSGVEEVVEMFGDDTLNNPSFGARNKAGIFQGLNVMKALQLSGYDHTRLFLDFVKKYPGKYIGNDYKFPETFATWVISNTPLDPATVKPYLISLPPNERLSILRKISGQVIDDKLIDTWLEEGMQQVSMEDIARAQQTAELIRDAIDLADPGNAGWDDFLFANIEKRLQRNQSADSFLSEAGKHFNSRENREGVDWVSNTRKHWEIGSQVRVGVQNGHILPYVIAQSKDQRFFATGGSDNLVKIWDRTLGKEIVTLRGHTDVINALDYSPNGRYLASVSDDGAICIWNAYNNSLIYKYNTGEALNAVRFSPDNKYIVTAGNDSLVSFRDLHTGKLEKTLRLHKGAVRSLAFHPLYNHVLYSAGTDSMVYKWDIESGEMTRWYKHKGRALSVQLSNDGQYMSVVSTDSLVQVWDTETNKKLFFGKINSYRSGTTNFYGTETFSPDGKYIAYPYRPDSFVVIRIKDFYQRSYPARVEGSRLMDLQWSRDGQSMFARYDMGGPLRIYNFVDWDIKEKPSISLRDIHPFGNIITSVQFTNDDNGLIVLHSEISKLDLRNGNNERLFYGYSPIDNSHLLLDDEKLGTYIDFKKPIVYFYDYANLEIVQSFALPDDQQISCFETSPGSVKMFISSKSGMIRGWDVKSNTALFTDNFASTSIKSLRYEPNGDKLYALSEGGEFLVIDATTGKLIHSLDSIHGNYVTSSDKFVYVTTEDGFLYKISGQDHQPLKKIRVIDEGLYKVTLNPEAGLLAMISNTEVFAYRLSTDSLVYRVKGHEFANTMIAISHDGERIATAGLDSKVNLYNALTGELIVNIHYPMNRNVLISDPEGHYLASRNTLDAITFTYNNTAYSFEQFDAKLNRPDLILKKIGRADSMLLRAYELAYQKRLKKMNISEEMLNSEVHLPFIRLSEKYAVQPVTTEKEFEVSVECSDSRFNLKSLHVTVNNSPLPGLRGNDLSKLGLRSYQEKIRIPLSRGLNKIKLYCVNEKGISSLQETFEIVSKHEPDQVPKTYFIGIGTAHYKDSQMNLQYSAKDIRDLSATFSNLFGNISIDTLIDKKATRENILALKKKLMQTTVNDRVILAVTGHGLLSDSLDFYYATWDVDFNKPEKRGIKYEELEDLLNNIPARQKLMLIDACHSGALDKEELLALRDDTTMLVSSDPGDSTVKGIAPRGLGKKKNKMEANSSFEMMQQLFTDLSGGNGAVIISAAGGMEYAFESGEWNNGVFTYCVRKGIDGDADREGNNDELVSVQELLKYVSNKVSELTKGKQKPTSRRENIDFEWIIGVR
jgi:WD40 repeat protein